MNSIQTVEREIPCPELTGLFYSMHEQFEGLKNLCQFVEEAISKETKLRRQRGKRQLDKIKSEEERAFHSVEIDANLFEVERDFPRIVRYSFFVSMMSTTEASLVRLCRIAHHRLAIKEKFNDRGNGVIKRALEYLDVKANLDTSRMEYYKKLAENLFRLRNVIAHSEGCINGRSDEATLRAYCKKPSMATIDKRSNLVISGRFVFNNAHEMEGLITRLIDKLRKQVAKHAI